MEMFSWFSPNYLSTTVKFFFEEIVEKSFNYSFQYKNGHIFLKPKNENFCEIDFTKNLL